MDKSTGFSISADTYILKNEKNDLESKSILKKDTGYIIPIYQRPYSWNEEQVHKLMSDIFHSFYGYERNSTPESLFIGTMQLTDSVEKNGVITHEIVDGQQRLSTFHLLLKILWDWNDLNKELISINDNWISTKVNRGEQQNLLDEFNKNKWNEESVEIGNRYIENGKIIKSFIKIEIEEHIGREDDFEFEKLIHHILTNIYFVVIETKAGLSKTLQIFNAINTTGLDLNGGDIFKIKMYEYLRDVEKEKKDIFNDIDSIYAKIDHENIVNGHTLNINHILHTYQCIIIAKFSLNKELYNLASDTFFERLFDTVFNNKQWANFSVFKGKKGILSLIDIQTILDTHRLFENISYPTFEDHFAINSIWHSRYGRFWDVILIYFFQHGKSKQIQLDVFEIVKEMNKLVLVYSVIFDKSIGSIKTFLYSLYSDIVKNGDKAEVLIQKMRKKKEEIVQQWNKSAVEAFKETLQKDIFYNAKKKNLLCKLSAFLEETEVSYHEKFDSNSHIAKLYSENPKDAIDIEHIESFNHKDEDERKSIHECWKEELNSIGNLMILEYAINRGTASNNPYPDKIKDDCYLSSKYAIVKNQVKRHKEWNLENCKNRKEFQV